MGIEFTTFEFIKTVLITTAWCVSIYNFSEKGDIFYWFRLAAKAAPKFLHKPLIDCINCMASIHGALILSVYYILIGGGTPVSIAIHFVLQTVFCSILNGFIYLWLKNTEFKLWQNEREAREYEKDS